MKFAKNKNDVLRRKPYGRRQFSRTPSKQPTDTTLPPLWNIVPIVFNDHDALKAIQVQDAPSALTLNDDESIISGNLLDKPVTSSNEDLIMKAEKLFEELKTIKRAIQANQNFLDAEQCSSRKPSLSDTLRNFKHSLLTPKSTLKLSARKKKKKKKKKEKIDEESICSEGWMEQLGVKLRSNDVFESTRIAKSSSPEIKQQQRGTTSGDMQGYQTPLLPLPLPMSPTHGCRSHANDISSSIKSQGQTKVTRGQVKVAVYVNSGLLTVHVLEAVNWRCLPGSETGTFVTVSFTPSDVNSPGGQTESVFNTLRPVFDEKISFEMMSGDESQRVLISAWHFSSISSKPMFIGCTSFNIETITSSMKMIRGWYHLLPEHLGRTKHSPVQDQSSSLLDQQFLQPVLFTTLQVVLSRGVDGYGFVMTGACPAVVCRVEERKSAHLAGMKAGDVIAKINNENVSTANCDQVARIIRHCRRKVVIQIKRPLKDSELLLKENSWPQLEEYENDDDSSESSSEDEDEQSFSLACRRPPRRLAFVEF